jgi:hypothetical protein
VVYEKDTFRYELGTTQTLTHQKFMGEERGARVAVWAIARFTSGADPVITVMPIHEIEKLRACSQMADGLAWSNHYDEMAKKTAVRRIAKNLPMSAQMVRAAILDEYGSAGVRADDAIDVTESGSDETATSTPPQSPPAKGAAQAAAAALESTLAQNRGGNPSGTQTPAQSRTAPKTEPPILAPEDPPESATAFRRDMLALRARFEAAIRGLCDDPGAEWRTLVLKLAGAEGYERVDQLPKPTMKPFMDNLASAVSDLETGRKE